MRDPKIKEMRTFLGKFQIQGNDALKPMGLLSGGQKSRVAFAALAYKRPHVLIIDEGILVVSHDSHFVTHRIVVYWRMAMRLAFVVPFKEYKAYTAEKPRRRVLRKSVKRLSTIKHKMETTGGEGKDPCWISRSIHHNAIAHSFSKWNSLILETTSKYYSRLLYFGV